MSEYLIDRKNREIAILKEKVAHLEKDYDTDMKMVYMAEVILFLLGIGIGALITTLLR